MFPILQGWDCGLWSSCWNAHYTWKCAPPRALGTGQGTGCVSREPLQVQTLPAEGLALPQSFSAAQCLFTSLIPISMSLPFLLVQEDLLTLLWSDSEIIAEVMFHLQARWILLQLFPSASFLLSELVLVLNLQTLSWLQSTGPLVVSEWLWAFIIAFPSRNFLFSSQKKWYPPFPAKPVPPIQPLFHWWLCRKGCTL